MTARKVLIFMKPGEGRESPAPASIRCINYRVTVGSSVSSLAADAAMVPNSGTAANILRVPRARAPAALQTPLPKLRPAFRTVSISERIFYQNLRARDS